MSAFLGPGSKRHVPSWRRIAVCAILSALAVASLAGQEALPQPTGFINDYAGVLDERGSARLEGLAGELRAKTGAEVAVAVLESLGGESLEDYTNRVAEHWGVGDQADRGVLLLLAIQERLLRIEVGYGLEGIIPDGAAGEIRDSMTPYLRQGDYNAAVAVAVGSIAATIAADAGVTLSGAAARPARRQRQRGGGSWLPWLLLAPLLLVRRRTVGGGWHGGPLAAAWMIGGMSRGSGGGYAGGGLSDGGFGGFGGGGFGGGGASGSW